MRRNGKSEITAVCRVCEKDVLFEFVDGVAGWSHTALVIPIHKVVVHGIIMIEGYVDPNLLRLAHESVRRMEKETPGIATPNEVRITNEKTGGQKGSKDAKYHLIPAGPLKELAELYGVGAKKYAPRNWELGYDWSLSYDALQRHANQFWAGEDKDEETGKSHLASVIFHAMALMQFAEEHPELDDRPHISKEKP